MGFLWTLSPSVPSRFDEKCAKKRAYAALAA